MKMVDTRAEGKQGKQTQTTDTYLRVRTQGTRVSRVAKHTGLVKAKAREYRRERSTPSQSEEPSNRSPFLVAQLFLSPHPPPSSTSDSFPGKCGKFVLRFLKFSSRRLLTTLQVTSPVVDRDARIIRPVAAAATAPPEFDKRA